MPVGHKIELRICPHCEKAFYTPVEDKRVVCLYCGYVLFDRRGALRTQKEVDFTISLNGTDVPVKLKDYSDDGLKIVCEGRDIKTDTFLDVDIKPLGIHKIAKTIWSKKVSESLSSIGLKLL